MKVNSLKTLFTIVTLLYIFNMVHRIPEAVRTNSDGLLTFYVLSSMFWAGYIVFAWATEIED